MPFYPYEGFYGEPKRNEPVAVRPANPLPDNAKSSDTGNAGRDGYTVLSRANPYTKVRPSISGHPEPLGPDMAQEQ